MIRLLLNKLNLKNMDEEYFRNQADLMTWLRNPQRSTYFIFKDEERGWVFDICFNVMNRENLFSVRLWENGIEKIQNECIGLGWIIQNIYEDLQHL